MREDIFQEDMKLYIPADINPGPISHDFSRVFSYEFEPISLDTISNDIPLEQTIPFRRLIVQYNEFCGENYEVLDILESQTKFRIFYDFVLANAFAGNIIIKKEHMNAFIYKLSNLQIKYNQTLRSLDKYYDEIVEKIYHPQGLTKEDKTVQKDMYMFLSAYTLMKQAFDEQERETKINEDEKEKYFTHLKGVMEIILRELPGASIKRVVIALLHDVIEDIPGYTFETLRAIYGEEIAKGVKLLTKKDRRLYLSEQERTHYDDAEKYTDAGRKILKWKAKARRNNEYFGNLDALEDDILTVKFADRIHNLRTMHTFGSKKIKRKLRETERFFMDVAKKRMPEAFLLLKREIEIWRTKIKNGEIK